MDKTYYDTHLEYLFSGNNPVYKINPLFKQFTLENNKFAYMESLKNVDGLQIMNQNPAKANQEEIKRYMSNIHNTGKTFPLSMSFSEQVDAGSIELYIIMRRKPTVDFNIIGKLFAAVNLDRNRTNHDVMYKFMYEENIKPVCRYQFYYIFKNNIIDNTLDPNCLKEPKASTCSHDSYIRALEHLSTSLSDREVEDIYNTLSKVGSAAVKDIIDNIKDIPVNLIAQLGLNTETSFESSPFYYRLRAKIVSNTSSLNDLFPRSAPSTIMYIRKILADLYIKTCYLQVHFDILDSLQKRHQQLGDFVNARFGILAMVNMTYMFIQNILENVKLLPNTEIIITNLNTRLELMSNYITALSNIERSGNNSENQLAKIIKSLHTKSLENYKASKSIAELKKEIQQHQIALNNIMVNSDHILRRYKLKYKEFVVITVLLFVLVIACTILFLFKQSTWVIWIALNVMRLIIVFLIIKLLTFFIYKN